MNQNQVYELSILIWKNSKQYRKNMNVIESQFSSAMHKQTHCCLLYDSYTHVRKATKIFIMIETMAQAINNKRFASHHIYFSLFRPLRTAYFWQQIERRYHFSQSNQNIYYVDA